MIDMTAAGLIGIASGFLGSIATIVKVGKDIKRGLRDEVHEGLILALNNGASEVLNEKIELALSKAFRDHAIACPLREPMSDLRQRMRDVEGR